MKGSNQDLKQITTLLADIVVFCTETHDAQLLTPPQQNHFLIRHLPHSCRNSPALTSLANLPFLFLLLNLFLYAHLALV